MYTVILIYLPVKVLGKTQYKIIYITVTRLTIWESISGKIIEAEMFNEKFSLIVLAPTVFHTVRLTVTKSVVHLVAFYCTSIILAIISPVQHPYCHGWTCGASLDIILDHCNLYHMKASLRQKKT